MTTARLRFSILFIALFLAFGISESQATHLAGGSIQYRRTTVANQYIITLTLYNDCSGIQNQIPFNNANSTVYYRNNCGGAPVSLNVTWLPGTGQEIPTACVTDPSTCQGGQRYGLRKYVWEGTVTLPFNTTSPTCNEWYFTWGNQNNANTGYCCRNNSNTLQGALNTNFFVDSYLNNNVANGNNSATYPGASIPAYCINEPINVIFDVTEPDGDSVVYGLVPALQAYNTNVNYAPNYSAALPAVTVGGVININPTSGNLSFLSANPQTSLFALQVNEFRAGVLVGYVKIDIQVILGVGRFCDNVTPSYLYDTVARGCGTWDSLNYQLELRSRVQCASVARDGSDFRLYRPNGQLIQIQSAAPDSCDSQDRTRYIDFVFAEPLDQNGYYSLVSRNGTDGNTLGNQCDLFMPLYDTMLFYVSDCFFYDRPLTLTNVSVDSLNPAHLSVSWTAPDSFDYDYFLAYNLFRAAPGENILPISARVHQETDSSVLFYYDYTSPVHPKDGPIRYNINMRMTDGNETRRSNTIASIRLDGGFASASPDNREVDLSWTAYNGWNLPEYVVQFFDYKNPGSGWIVAAGPTTDTFVRYERPRPKGKYALRIRTTSPDGSLRSYSNPIDFDMPSRPVEIPNVITPNGDNLNDVLVIENLDYYPGAVFRVFNRWGQKVFESSDYQNNFGGDELESGSYFYELIITEDGQQQQFKGTMRIMRG